MRKEYDLDLMRQGQRGKYAEAYKQGSNLVKVDDDLYQIFANPVAVNNALRQFAKEHDLIDS